jgi:hypothetical protein
VAVLVGMLMPAGAALAHEHRAVGDYELTVGFLNEPALADEPNGLDLRVTFFPDGVPAHEEEGEEEHGEPVEGLEESLRAEVIVGGGAQKMELTLEPRWQTPGAYDGLFIPTLAGDYTYHIYGQINGQTIDETFSSGPETFSSVDDPAALQFPVKTTGDSELTASLDELSARVDATDTDDNADTAFVLAIVGIAVGIVGIGAGGFALVGARRR